MNQNGSIGFFDSGVGGLTIWNEVLKTLPYENTIYIADSINAPYGTKSKQEIIDLSISSTETLINRGAKIIVVACNTATTQAIETLREKFDIPFIGIEPAIKPAALSSITQQIAVLATYGTLDSDHFNATKDKFTSHIEVVTRVGEGLVTAIERGELHSVKLRGVLHRHLELLISDKTDYLVLGCTHYPLLIPMIKEIIGEDVTIVDSGKAVAEQTKRILRAENLISDSNILGTHSLLVSGKMGVMKSIIRELGRENHPNIRYSSLYQAE